LKIAADPNDTACRRCGACCQKGGPALHIQDLHLFKGPGALSLAMVVTLRPGELAFDQPKGRLLPLATEVLKLRGVKSANAERIDGGNGWACALLTQPDNTRALYERRPAGAMSPVPTSSPFSGNAGGLSPS